MGRQRKLTGAEDEEEDSLAPIPADEETLAANRLHFQRRRKAIHIPRRAGHPGGAKTRAGIACSCGATFKKGSPAHKAHTKNFPSLCRRRAGP